MTATKEFTPLEWRDDGLALLDQTKLPGRGGLAAPAAGRGGRRRDPPARRPRRAGDRRRRGLRPGGRARRTTPTPSAISTAASSAPRACCSPPARPRSTCAGRSSRAPQAASCCAIGRATGRSPGCSNGRAPSTPTTSSATAASAEHGATLFAPGDRALTHCNAGALATGGIGTALGVLGAAFRAGRLAQVWVDETRPLLQGARLTAWELARLGIPHRLVTDSMVGALMRRGLVDRVVVGADRIAANGDVANKIGTYTVAVLAAPSRRPVLRRGAAARPSTRARRPAPISRSRSARATRSPASRACASTPPGAPRLQPRLRRHARRARRRHRHRGGRAPASVRAGARRRAGRTRGGAGSGLLSRARPAQRGALAASIALRSPSSSQRWSDRGTLPLFQRKSWNARSEKSAPRAMRASASSRRICSLPIW